MDFNQFIRVVISPMLIMIIVPLLFVFINLSNSKKEVKYEDHDCIVLVMPKIYVIIGAMVSVEFIIFIIITYLGIMTPSNILVYLSLIIIVLLGICIIIESLCKKIIIDKKNKTIISRSYLGRIKKVHLKNIHSYKNSLKLRQITLYTEKGRITVPDTMINYKSLITFINQYHIPYKKKEE